MKCVHSQCSYEQHQVELGNESYGIPTDNPINRTKFKFNHLGSMDFDSSLIERRIEGLVYLTQGLQSLGTMNDADRQIGYGNVSAIILERENPQSDRLALLITRSSMPLQVASADLLTMVSDYRDGSVTGFSNNGSPSSESPMHWKVAHSIARDGFLWIAHGHYAVPILEEMEKQGVEVSGREYMCYGTDLLAEQVVNSLLPRMRRQYGILKKHGFLAIGYTPQTTLGVVQQYHQKALRIASRLAISINDYKYLPKIG